MGCSSIWLSAQAETSPLEKALASLTVAVDNAKKETVTKQNAYNAGAKKTADAAKQAESMKAAITKAADIENKALAALETLKLAIAASK